MEDVVDLTLFGQYVGYHLLAYLIQAVEETDNAVGPDGGLVMWRSYQVCWGGGRGITTILTISTFASREVAVFPLRSLSAGVVDATYGLGYCNAVRHL